jgi:protein dithiol:quinone oxidoreductase
MMPWRARSALRDGASNAASFAFVAVASFGAVVAALVSQHAFGMQPCPWCVLQRLIFVAIGAFALLGLVWRGAAGSRVAATFALLLAIAGVATAFWHYFVAAKSASCNLTLADRVVGATQLDRLLPDVFEARVSCADGAVDLFGVPYPMWAAFAFVVCAIALLRILRASV